MDKGILFRKYYTKVPRYTSYPTIVDWCSDVVEDSIVIERIRNDVISRGFYSLYIHIPFCGSLCTFCGCNKLVTKKRVLVRPYLNSVIKEYEMYRKLIPELAFFPLKSIHLGGGTPTYLNVEEMSFFLESIFKFLVITDQTEISIEIDPRVTHKEHYVLLKNFSFSRISIGVQDTNIKVQKAINRVQDRNLVERALSFNTRYTKASVNFDILYGLPYQGQDNICNTFNLIEEFRPQRIAFYSYASVPAKNYSQASISQHCLHGYKKYMLYKKGYIFFQSIGYQSIGLDHFCVKNDSMFLSFKRKKIGRSFMGYTTYSFEPVIGLGVSAIGSYKSLYVQNEKDLVKYIDSIAKSSFPFIKQHMTTYKEIVLRNHIMDIMIYGSTSWEMNNEFVLNCLRKNDFLLQELIKDGIIIYDENFLSLTEHASPFRRLVGALFDHKREEIFQQKIFSSVF